MCGTTVHGQRLYRTRTGDLDPIRIVLSKQCHDRRIPDLDTVRQEVADWEYTRNEERATVSRYFTTDRARAKLKRFYDS